MASKVSSTILFFKQAFGTMAKDLHLNRHLLRVVQAIIEEKSERPKPKFEVHWANPYIADEKGHVCRMKAEKALSTQVFPLPILYHGTSMPCASSIMQQAERNNGTIDERGCTNGDRLAGIYGTGDPFISQIYTGAETVVEFCSVKPCFDEVRGTVYFPKTQPIFPVKVLRVQNFDEIGEFVKLGIVNKTSLLFKSYEELRKDPGVRELLTSCDEEKLKEYIRSKY